MARKLGKTTDQRMAMLKNLTTDLLVYGRIETTEARAKEVRSLAENLIALAIKEKDNFETVDQKVVKAKLDSKGNKELEKDMPSRLNARRKIMANTNKVKDKDGNKIDLPAKLFGELASKYAGRQGGYTRIYKMGPRRGDSAEKVIIELV